MRKAEVHETPTLFALVHRAAEVCDPAGTEEGAAELLRRFEDRDEPVGDPAEAEQTIAEEKGAVDPQDEDPVAMMTAAVATYLAYRRDGVDVERDDLLILAARAEFDGKPPEPVASWLAEQGLEA
jgi:3-hydroxy-3-methylglutaryl CoA synthase